MDWQKKDCKVAWGGAGILVERDGQLGFAKLNHIKEEKLASDLGILVCVPVARVEIGTVAGRGPFAISHVHSCSSKPLATKEQRFSQNQSEDVNAALKQASGLLPFLAWIADTDHNDDTNFIIDRLDNDCRVTAIDFEFAFSWIDSEDKIELPNGSALVRNVDPATVNRSLQVIETLAKDRILECCKRSYDDEAARRIAKVLERRKWLLREPLNNQGWLPLRAAGTA